ncbi:MAG: hypothetical protein ACR2MG_13460 [Pyrinomonadaceae bacterium]
MLNKTLSLLMIICLLTITNLFVFGQSQSFKSENSQQSNTLSKKEFLDKFGINERGKELLEKDSIVKVKEESITAKAMQDADKAQQKKKFIGMNTTTAIIIGAVLAAAIIIVLATKKDSRELRPICDLPPNLCTQ